MAPMYTPESQGSLYEPFESPVLSAGNEAWKRWVQALDADQRDFIEQRNIQDARQFTLLVQEESTAQTQSSTSLKLARKAKPTCDFLAKLSRPGAKSLEGLVPGSGSTLIAAGAETMLAMPGIYLKTQQMLNDTLADLQPRLDSLKDKYSKIYKDDENVREAVIRAYIAILELFGAIFASAYKKTHGKDWTVQSRNKTIKYSALDSAFREDIKYLVEKYQGEVTNLQEIIDITSKQRQDVYQTDSLSKQNRLVEEVKGIRKAQRTLSEKIEVGFSAQAQERDERKLREQEKYPVESKLERESLKRTLLDWIPFLGFVEEEQKRKAQQTLAGTGQWVLDNEIFLAWDSQIDRQKVTGEVATSDVGHEADNVIRFEGKAGSGKSCLASMLIQRLRTKKLEDPSASNKIALGYIYCNSPLAAERDPERLLASMLYQLYTQTPDDYVLPALEKHHQMAFKSFQLDLVDIEKLVIEVLGYFDRTYLVVDGLDECLSHDHFEQFCTSIRRLGESHGSRVRLAVFSRPQYLAITEALGSYPCVSIDASGAGNESDIKAYVEQMVSGKDFLKRQDQELISDVKATLLKKANGMFLWVKLVVKTLAKARTKADMYKRLEALPPDLFKLYEDLLDRIVDTEDDKDLFLQVLMWVANAEEPLSRGALADALAMTYGLDPDDSIADEELTVACGDLIVLREGCYFLLHTSLGEYLTNLDRDKSVRKVEYRQLQAEAHTMISQACVKHLMLARFRSVSIRRLCVREEAVAFAEANPFWYYAAKHLSYHVSQTSEALLSDELLSLCIEAPVRNLILLVLGTLFVWSAHSVNLTGSSDELATMASTPLHLVAFFNLVHTAERLTEAEKMILAPDFAGSSCLDWAIYWARHGMAMWLLRTALDKSIDLASGGILRRMDSDPLHRAAGYANWGDVVQLLIRLGSDVNKHSWSTGETALHWAARIGNIEPARALLAAGCHPDSRDNYGATPLILASYGSHSDMVCLLLDHDGAGEAVDVNAHDGDGMTALHIAAFSGSTSVASELISRGADWSALDKFGRTPLGVAARFNKPGLVKDFIDIEPLDTYGKARKSAVEDIHLAMLDSVLSGNTDTLQLMLKALKSHYWTQKGPGGRNILHAAIDEENQEAAKLVAASDPRLIHEFNDLGDNPFHTAIYLGEEDIALFLLSQCPPVAHERTSYGRTPLYMAMRCGLGRLVKELILTYKVDVNATGADKVTLLHCCAYYNYIQYLDLLLNAGIRLDAVAPDGGTALHVAAARGHVNFAKALLDVGQESVGMETESSEKQTLSHNAAVHGHGDYHGQSSTPNMAVIGSDAYSDLPVHAAAAEGHIDCVMLLLSEDNIDSRGSYGRTLLSIASERGDVGLVSTLLERHANVDLCDEHGTSPLVHALLHGHLDAAELLMSHGADVLKADNHGRTPLCVAAKIGSSRLVSQILLQGGNALQPRGLETLNPFQAAAAGGSWYILQQFLARGINGCHISTASGWTVYHCAAENGDPICLANLIEAGKEVNASPACVNMDGESPLGIAARLGHVDALRVLLDYGLDPNGVVGDWNTPCYAATQNGHIDIVQTLIQQRSTRGFNVDQPGLWSPPPIIMAVRCANRAIFHLLVNAGANLAIRDNVGKSCLEYARQGLQVWSESDMELMQSSLDDPPTRRQQAQILSSAVQRIATHLLQIPEDKRAYARDVDLWALTDALTTSLHHEATCDAAHWLEERYHGRTFRGIRRWVLACDLCELSITEADAVVYKCRSQLWNDLCEPCYKAVVEHVNASGLSAEQLWELSQLEKQLHSVRGALKPRNAVDPDVYQRALALLPSLKDWVLKTVSRYSSLMGHMEDNSGTEVFETAVWKLLLILNPDDKSMYNHAPPKGSVLEAGLIALESLRETLLKLDEASPPGYLAEKLVFSQLEYIKIRINVTNWEDKVTDQWLRELQAKYQSADLDGVYIDNAVFYPWDAPIHTRTGQTSENLDIVAPLGTFPDVPKADLVEMIGAATKAWASEGNNTNSTSTEEIAKIKHHLGDVDAASVLKDLCGSLMAPASDSGGIAKEDKKPAFDARQDDRTWPWHVQPEEAPDVSSPAIRKLIFSRTAAVLNAKSSLQAELAADLAGLATGVFPPDGERRPKMLCSAANLSFRIIQLLSFGQIVFAPLEESEEEGDDDSVGDESDESD